MTNPVEGYNMLIFEREDGSVTYTGSFNRAEWDAYLGKRGGEATVDEGTVVPDVRRRPSLPRMSLPRMSAASRAPPEAAAAAGRRTRADGDDAVSAGPAGVQADERLAGLHAGD
jgi:hypothetical protein